MSGVTSELSCCFQLPSRATQSVKRKKMWVAYHRVRTSHSFTGRWIEFLPRATDTKPHPAFFQNVTATMFANLVQQHLPIATVEATDQPVNQEFSFEERNALRYVAGYVPRHLKKRLETSAHPMKKEFTLCLLDLLQEGEHEDDPDHSTEWLNAIDRGGLKHVNSATYHALLRWRSGNTST